MTSEISSAKAHRIEDFRSDLTKKEIDSARFDGKAFHINTRLSVKSLLPPDSMM